MIATVTLNAAIDKMYRIPGFTPGAVNRARSATSTPGGKGLNVARVLRALGEDATAAGFVGGYNGDYIVAELDRIGMRHEFVRTVRETRLCLNLVDTNGVTPVSTEILEEGPEIEENELASMMETIKRLAAQSRIIVLSGSLPRGVSADLYARIIEMCKPQGAVIYLDASGQALREGIRANPHFIKPNKDEISAFLEIDNPSEEQLTSGIRKLLEAGVRTAVVTLGAAGAVAGHEGELYKVYAPRVEAVNTVGCGDAFVAGMAAAERRALPFEQRLAYATAVATAAALTERTGEVKPEDVDWLLPLVRVEALP